MKYSPNNIVISNLSYLMWFSCVFVYHCVFFTSSSTECIFFSDVNGIFLFHLQQPDCTLVCNFPSNISLFRAEYHVKEACS